MQPEIIGNMTDGLCILLSQAGLSKSLRTLTDCEALLNDGTAYTLFFVLKGFAEGADLSAADTVRQAVTSAPHTCLFLGHDTEQQHRFPQHQSVQ